MASPNFWTGVRRGGSAGCAFGIWGSKSFWRLMWDTGSRTC